MSIKCIALDLDGTALIDDQHLSGRTTTAIQEALKRGIKVVVASGRCFDTLPDSIKLIKGIEYAITSNGAAIYHIPTGSCVHKLSVPEALVPVIIKLTQEAHCAIEVFLNGKAYAGQTCIENPSEYGVDDEFIDYVRTTRTGVTDLSAFMLQHKKELDSIDLLIPKMEEYHSLLRAIKEENLDIYITSSVNNRIEISS